MLISEFRGPGFTEVQWQYINSLATSLDARQLMWASGFLAGAELLRSNGAAAVAPSSPAPALAPATPAVQPAQRRLTVLYASETGNSAALAATLADQATAKGLQAAAHDLASYKTRNLASEQDVLIITSTYGEGDPPQPAAGFFEFIEGRKAPKLGGLRFAVLALGDSTYEHFCEAGKRLDRRFEELGATRLQPRIDCDVDYDQPAQAWADRLLAALEPASGQDAPPAAHATVAAATPVAARYDKRHPYAANVIDNLLLTGRGSSKETRHIELSLAGSGLSYEPGDALGIMPSNDPALVRDILAELGAAAEAPVSVLGDFLPLGRALQERLEITAITPRFLEHWGKLAQAPRLQALAQPDQAEARADFARHHHIVDVLRQFPAKGLDPQDVLAALRPLQPRLYSIASSPLAAPDEAHLTVSVVRYDLQGAARTGVASGHLAERALPDAALPVYIHSNPHFRLPADDVPIIMIGAGTGVAPYRAFLQEREARGAAGRSWLFFGDRNFRSDFLYQTEWQGLLKDGVLTRMDVAFSRDRQAAGGKTYVQHRLQEQAQDVYAWLEEGAHVYLCGDATRLAPDVHQALEGVIASQGRLAPEAAHDYLRRLQRDNRYQRDVY